MKHILAAMMFASLTWFIPVLWWQGRDVNWTVVMIWLPIAVLAAVGVYHMNKLEGR